MNDILKEIIKNKKNEIEKAKKNIPPEEIKRKAAQISGVRDFERAVSRKDSINIIAEIKKASPSKGVLRQDFDVTDIAAAYDSCGACAISVLTEEKYFKGSLKHINEAKAAVSLPILRKDFFIDEYQLYESKVSGADAVLLIAAVLEGGKLEELYAVTKEIGVAALVEVHNTADLDKALKCGADIIGINNRDLTDFKVNTETAKALFMDIPKGRTVVVESGIHAYKDIREYITLGINTFLIGEAFMKSRDICAKFSELKGEPGK